MKGKGKANANPGGKGWGNINPYRGGDQNGKGWNQGKGLGKGGYANSCDQSFSYAPTPVPITSHPQPTYPQLMSIPQQHQGYQQQACWGQGYIGSLCSLTLDKYEMLMSNYDEEFDESEVEQYRSGFPNIQEAEEKRSKASQSQTHKNDAIGTGLMVNPAEEKKPKKESQKNKKKKTIENNKVIIPGEAKVKQRPLVSRNPMPPEMNPDICGAERISTKTSKSVPEICTTRIRMATIAYPV